MLTSFVLAQSAGWLTRCLWWGVDTVIARSLVIFARGSDVRCGQRSGGCSGGRCGLNTTKEVVVCALHAACTLGKSRAGGTQRLPSSSLFLWSFFSTCCDGSNGISVLRSPVAECPRRPKSPTEFLGSRLDLSENLPLLSRRATARSS